HRYAQLAWLIRRAGDRNQPDFALHEKVVRLSAREWARRTVSGDIADDQARVARAERRGREAEPLAGAGTQILDEHVGAHQEPIQDGTRLRMLQIECQRLLRSIQPDEVARKPLHGRVV